MHAGSRQAEARPTPGREKSCGPFFALLCAAHTLDSLFPQLIEAIDELLA